MLTGQMEESGDLRYGPTNRRRNLLSEKMFADSVRVAFGAFYF